MRVPCARATPNEKFSERYRQLLKVRRNHLQAAIARLPHDRDPYDLEIGCGHGHFLAAYAQAHPDRHCLGIDIAGGRLERARRKTDRAGLTNVDWIQSDARLFLECVPETIRFARVFILFPDPWPKKRHHKNRLVGVRFLDFLAGVCQPGAELYFRSDHIPYVEEAEKAIDTSDTWCPQPGAAWPREEPSVFQNLAAEYRSVIAVKA